MKAIQIFFVLIFTVKAAHVFAQTNFIYDQQSAVEGANAEGGGFIPGSQPLGQSFTPMFTKVGFIRLWLDDLGPGNGIGSTVIVNIHTNSITGAILASSDAVFMPDNFGVGSGNYGYPNFFFSPPLAVSPGVTYYLEAVLQSGDAMGVVGDVTYRYSGGTMFLNASARTLQDLWFREGIVVPEPSAGWLALVGAGVLVGWRWRRRGQNRSLS